MQKKLIISVNLWFFSFQYTSMKTVGVKAVDDTFKVSLHECVFENRTLEFSMSRFDLRSQLKRC